MQNDTSSGPVGLIDLHDAVFKTELDAKTLPATVSSDMADRFWDFRDVMANSLKAGSSFTDASKQIQRIAGDELGQAIVDYFQRLFERVVVVPWPPAVIVDPDAAYRRWYVGPTESSHQWNSYHRRLEESSSVGGQTLRDLDSSTTGILGLMPAPGRPDFSGRGLVMGYVQSGKTMNFMGLIAKAVDEGYKLVIVLSGVTNNLRDQTQARIKRDLATEQSHQWHWLTSEKQDFATTENFGSLIEGSSLLIAVVKKNAARLRKLHAWMNSTKARNSAKVLVIDDECDQATINTARGLARKTAVHKALTDLIDPNFLPRLAYVGYSATPFANMLAEANEGSLYPKDFISSLPRNDGYFGPAEMFGRDAQSDSEDDIEGSNIIRDIPNSEVELVRPPKGSIGAWSPPVTGALRDSVIWFVIAHSLRTLRRNEKQLWSTMMVHTSQNIGPHEVTRRSLADFLETHKADSYSALQLLAKQLYESEIDLAKHLEPERAEFDWQTIWQACLGTLSEVRIVVDNYRSNDRLNYSTTNTDQDPAAVVNKPGPVIVVGGNTLSRGLTLEGLVSSYFFRTSNAYDSLLQMGRWFGYRPGYADLQRIWMANEAPYKLSKWFRELAFVEEEIREQIESYALEGLTPAELGIRIRKIPGMAITAAAKMQHAVSAQISYSGAKIQTILFDKSGEIQRANLEAVRYFIEKLHGTSCEPVTTEDQPVFFGVKSEAIADFFSNFSFHPDSRQVSREPLLKYVQGRNEEGELLEWNVAIYSNSRKTAKPITLGAGVTVRVANRAQLKSGLETDRYDIKTLMSVGDTVADAPELKAKAMKAEGQLRYAALKELRRHHGTTAGKALLGIYIIDKDSAPDNAKSEAVRKPLDSEEHLVGLYIVFPESRSQQAVDYLIPDLRAFENFEEVDAESDILENEEQE